MPGSPPKRIKEPGTIPPPNTRFNSPSIKGKRLRSSISMSEMDFGCAFGLMRIFEVFESRFTTSSTIVFHSLQEGHLPSHFGLCAPQL